MHKQEERTELLEIPEGGRVPFPESDYELGVEAVRHRTAKGPNDEHARSMVTCTVIVFEGGFQVHQELVVDGEVAWFRDLEIRLMGADEGKARLHVHRSPFVSTLPRPADK
jgi:hypothetical protein